MLDAIILEKAGIPAIPIITDAFASATREMVELWGLPDFRFVMTPHTRYRSRETTQDIERRADELLDKVLVLLQQGQPS